MSIAIVGTREPTDKQIHTIRCLVRENQNVSIVTGGALGTDFEAFYWVLKKRNEEIKRFQLMKNMPVSTKEQRDKIEESLLTLDFSFVCSLQKDSLKNGYHEMEINYEHKHILTLFAPCFDDVFRVGKYHIRNEQIVKTVGMVYIFMRKEK